MFFGLWLVAYLTYRFTLQITDIHGSCFSRPCWTMEYTLVFPPPPWLLNILFISPLLVEILQFNFPVRLQCLALGLSSPPMCIPRHALSGVEASSYKLHLSAVGDISRLQTGVLLPVPTLFSHQTVLHYPKVANLHQVLLGLLDQGVIIPVLVVKLFRGFYLPTCLLFLYTTAFTPSWISRSWFIWIQKFCMESIISVNCVHQPDTLTSVDIMNVYYRSSEYLSFYNDHHKIKDGCSSLTLKRNPTPNTWMKTMHIP